MLKFMILQVIGLGIFFGTWVLGWPQFLYYNDVTKLTLVIFGLTVFGVCAQALKAHNITLYLIKGLPRYGIFGTVVGLMMVINSSRGDFDAVWQGLGVAFCTTIAGLIGSEWLRLSRESYVSTK